MTDQNEKANISISNDGLQAYMILLSQDVSLSEISREIQNIGVSYGIKSSVIKDALERKIYFRKLLIAEGKSPENGHDGFVECLVQISPQPKLTVEDKSINYFPVWITNVYEGQKLLKITPPTSGINGITVTGKEIPAKPGKPPRSFRGLNTKFSETNRNYLVADKSGNFIFKEGKAEVHTEYRVLGDLGLVNGDIFFLGSLYISGNIMPGITVKIEGNLEVGGGVEDSMIEARGKILIKGGFMGYGRGKITADDDVTINHVMNQTVITSGNIYIIKEAVNCTLSGTSIFASNASIFGSSLTAQNIIEINNLGRSQHSVTKVFVGDKQQRSDIIRRVEKDIREKEVMSRQMKEQIYKLLLKKMNFGSLTDEEDIDLHILQREFDIIPIKIKKLSEHRDHLMEELNRNIKPKVIINSTVFPNVLISINDIKLQISEKETNVTFIERNNSIIRLKNEIF